MRLAVLAAFVGAILSGPDAAAARLPWLLPPVDHAISRRFEPPEQEYGSGHRGIDYGVVPGVAVRAAAGGTVSFAGRVPTGLAVTVSHPGGLQTTYSLLSELYVSTGDEVGQGRYLGTAGRAHPGEWAGLHFGVKVNGVYVDPTSFLGPVDASRAIHLAPLAETYAGDVDDDLLRAGGGAGTYNLGSCRSPAALPRRPPPPNDNIAVAVAGFGTNTTSGVPELYTRAFGPEALGYQPQRIYYFSYRGLERAYERRDTYSDLRGSAARLLRLLARISRRHPGSAVDLIGHSQGGIVARAALAAARSSWQARLPAVEHLVTLAAPHQGTALAAVPGRLIDHTYTGRYAVDAVGAWAARGGPVPDPRAASVRQLAPGSRLIRWLASEDTTFGTSVLSLSAAGDLVVAPGRSGYRGARHHVLGPAGFNAHEAIVHSESARAHAYAFLRDAAPACRSPWEGTGRALGAAVDFVEGHAGHVYAGVERGALGTVAAAIGAVRPGLAWLVGAARAWLP